ncbi:MAG: amidohydrolase family protein [Acidobacteriota bacterium]
MFRQSCGFAWGPMTRILAGLLLCGLLGAPQSAAGAGLKPPRFLKEVNTVRTPQEDQWIVIRGATLIDGRGGAPLPDAYVSIRGNRIERTGPSAALKAPAGAQIVEAGGLTLLPGLIDSHFHLGGEDLPALFLSHGVTSVRDPGQWIEAYDGVQRSGRDIPRLFLAGPHLDTPPPAYPADSAIVRDPAEVRQLVNRLADQGASSIKVYFRLPLGSVQAAVEAAHSRGLVVTAHLEIVSAVDAIEAGVDGIEHITSFGTSLLPWREAEKYRQSVLADNNARSEGRYRVWSELNFDTPQARKVIDLVVRQKTFLSATLAVFERRPGDRDATDLQVRGFRKMLEFVGRAGKAGARVVVGSHSAVPHAERGWAYQREMELLVESGLSPMQAIVAATLEGARFFHAEDRLGTIEAGKVADLVLIEGDPLSDIRTMRRVRRVMLNGQWVEAR